MPRKTSRRSFMKGTAAAAAAGTGYWVWNQRTYAASKSPNEKVQIGWIGVGGKGDSDSTQAGEAGKLVAICDVDENTLANKAEKFADAEQFNDYREMIDKLGDKVDAIGVSVPDHNHFPAAMLAMKHGKHVYCQKPLTWSIWEARQLREMAAKKGLKTQMGNQGSASDGLRKGVEWLQAGVIGGIKEIHVWTNRPIWPQAPEVKERPPQKDPPKHLHWDLWLGPAPERPYGEYEDKELTKRGKGAYHPFNWRGWLAFGTGALGDMACHTANLPFYAAKLKYPTSVRAEAGDVNPETYPSWAHIIWDYPERDGMPGVKFHWYEGRKDGKLVQPDREMFKGVHFADAKDNPKDKDTREDRKDSEKFPASGALVVGEKGSLFQYDDYGNGWKLLPEADMKDVKGPSEQTLKRMEGDRDLNMKKEWVSAIRGEIDQAFSNFGYAGVLTEAMLLGNIAIRNHGKELKWDGDAMKFTNMEDANQWLQRKPRSGWDVMG